MTETMHPDRALDLASAENVRDLGGYSTADGRTTQWGRFVRAGDMDQLSAADQRRLVDYGIATVIDLRMQREVRELPNVFERSNAVRFRNHDFWGDRFDDYRSKRRGAPPAVKLADLYCAGLVASGFVMAEIMRTIAESEQHGVAYHCRSGKDRTGLVSALLLALAGVSKETIAADYALTAHYLPELGKRVNPGQPGAYLQGCAPETMMLTLEFIDREFAGAEGYLGRVGVSDADLDRVRTKLLD